jgi:membrane protein YqaA with SNARE-associated domain
MPILYGSVAFLLTHLAHVSLTIVGVAVAVVVVWPGEAVVVASSGPSTAATTATVETMSPTHGSMIRWRCSGSLQ